MISFIFTILLITIHTVTGNQKILNVSTGSRCSTNTNISGICKLLSECSEAKEIIRNGEVPTICTYEGENYERTIVCCPKDHTVSTISTTCSIPTNTTGVCIPLIECAVAKNSIDNGQIPTICSIEGKNYDEVIACCPEQIIDLQKESEYQISIHEENIHTYAEKCKEYGAKVFTTVRDQIPMAHATFINKSLCDLSGKPLIVGGEKAAVSMYPHMALIGYTWKNEIKWNCDGSLISERFVLTSAQCINHKKHGEAKYVRLGDSESNPEFITQLQLFNITQRVIHPHYTKPSMYNDIGLLKLDRDILFSSLVRPICLYDKDIPPNKLITTGWGGLGEKNVSSQDLQYTIVDLYPYDKCNFSDSRRFNNGILSKQQICTIIAKYEQQSCGKFSGGPLQIHHENVYCMFQLVGVKSLGNSCKSKNNPEIYTKVSFYLPWIQTIVWK